MKTAPMTKHQRIKDLSNKAEGIFHYIGPNDLLFRLISTGNQLASEVNHSVAFFTNFAQSGLMSGPASRSCIDQIYRLVGTLMCQIDVIHAAAGEQIMPEPFESIDYCYGVEYRTLLREAVIKGLPDNYKGPQQNPPQISLVRPAVSFGHPKEELDWDPDEFDTGEFLNFNAQEEPRDRKIVFHCTKSELDSIKRYADIIEISYQEEDIHHA
jgi:hypothetical protein